VSDYYYVYIMTNRRDEVLYAGVTNNLKRRAYEHKAKLVGSFTARYQLDKLVYFEVAENPRCRHRQGEADQGRSSSE